MTMIALTLVLEDVTIHAIRDQKAHRWSGTVCNRKKDVEHKFTDMNDVEIGSILFLSQAAHRIEIGGYVRSSLYYIAEKAIGGVNGWPDECRPFM